MKFRSKAEFRDFCFLNTCSYKNITCPLFFVALIQFIKHHHRLCLTWKPAWVIFSCVCQAVFNDYFLYFTVVFYNPLHSPFHLQYIFFFAWPACSIEHIVRFMYINSPCQFWSWLLFLFSIYSNENCVP